MNSCKYVLTVFLLFIIDRASAQDSLRVTLDSADRLFLQKNLLMIAAQLNVDAQKALEIQAKLYPNPQITLAANVYDAQNKKIFYAGANGEKAFEFDQLILLGGKRKKQVVLAKQNTKLAQLQLEDLLRNLKYQLHNNLFSVYFDRLTISQYSHHLQQLDSIIMAYQIQADKGNIALKEVVRLKSAYMSLNNEKAELLRNIESEQKDLRLLLQSDQFILPDLNDIQWDKFENLLPVDSLHEVAFQHRSDLQEAFINKGIADWNIRYQKSLTVPDITLGTSYDQRGSAFSDTYLFTVAFPLPFWNRNQGNIISAQAQSKAAEKNQQYVSSAIFNEVSAAWKNMRQSIEDFQKTVRLYNSDFTIVFDGITSNFLKRNISLLEFVDFIESQNATIAEVNRAKKQLILSAETINYSVGFPVY